MMRLHCDKCDKIIYGTYYEVQQRSTLSANDMIAQAFQAPSVLCPDCLYGTDKEEVSEC